MRFIDSNIVAYAFYENEFQEPCRAVLREGGIIDTLVLCEAFNIIEHETNREIAQKVIKALLSTHIVIVSLDISVIFEAIKRAERYKKLSFLDLLHFTVSQLHSCEEIISYDKDFDRLPIPRNLP